MIEYKTYFANNLDEIKDYLNLNSNNVLNFWLFFSPSNSKYELLYTIESGVF
jgi:hypothetical protein